MAATRRSRPAATSQSRGIRATASFDEVHPIVPLFDGMGIEFAIMSYADRLSICAVADPRLVPDASDIEGHLHAAADELQHALGIRKPKAVADV